MNVISVILACLPVVSADMGVEWRKDYEAARKEARATGRLILLHFYQAGRPLCQAMDEETFAHAEVARIAGERFVSVRVDVEARPDLFEGTIGGRGGLATCVADGEGDVISALHGYAGPKAFLLFLEKAQAGHAALKSARDDAASAPGNLAKLFALAEAYRISDSPRRSEECYRKVIEQAMFLSILDEATTRAFALSHERLARLKILRGRNLEAREHLVGARRLDPTGRFGSVDRLLLTEALTFAVERKHADAARVLQDALKRFPSSGETDHMLFALGFVLHEGGQDKPALDALETAARRFPESPWLPALREQIEHIRNPQPDHSH